MCLESSHTDHCCLIGTGMRLDRGFSKCGGWTSSAWELVRNAGSQDQARLTESETQCVHFSQPSSWCCGTLKFGSRWIRFFYHFLLSLIQWIVCSNRGDPWKRSNKTVVRTSRFNWAPSVQVHGVAWGTDPSFKTGLESKSGKAELMGGILFCLVDPCSLQCTFTANASSLSNNTVALHS